MVGRSVASYEILETLGEGGMGVVYKARDIRLERFVALKFLKPEGITAERRNRFLQEAKSISALNHPNIVHVYDIGQWDGADYIAMEYVEGVTLQNLLNTARLPFNQALNFAIQISDAMAAAHEAGIVHRDLKPGNILITGRKRVKVVDFGLAKLVDPDTSSASAETQTALAKPVYTVAGMIVGSLAYMSPEQAEGKPIDARSDIFAFGLVLYEMLAGRPAFAGSKFEVLSAIVNDEPKQLSDSSPDIVPELDWIVARCLRKDPERRFQRMAEVRAALEDLRAETSSSGNRRALSSSQIAAPPSPPPAAPKLASIHRRWLIWGNIFALLCVAAAVFWLARRSKNDERELPELVRLTTENGLNIDPAISPDGKFLAYASDRAGKGDLDIWVRQIGGSDAVQLTRDPADDDEPAFSPDGTQIAFHSNRDGGGLYIVPTLGGAERKIADGGRNPRFSPDGQQIAYWIGPKVPYPLRSARPQMYLVDLATSATRRLRPDFVASLDPIWSPDGRHILFHGLQKIDPSDRTDDWWITPLDDGVAKPFGHLMADSDAPRLWAWHDNTIYLIDDSETPEQVSRIEVDPKSLQPVGTPKRMTTSTTLEDSPSISHEGRLVFTSLIENTNLYALPFQSRTGQSVGDPIRLTRHEGQDVAGSLSADGSRLVFTSLRTGNEEVWTRNMNTEQERQLTYGGTRPRIDPKISPNGELVAWRETYVERPRVIITPFAGGSSHETCADCAAPEIWTADSRFLLYRTGQQPHAGIGIFNLANGEHSSYLSDPNAAFLANSITSDGKWLLFTSFRGEHDYSIYAAPFSVTHPPRRDSWIELLRSPDADPNPVWSSDGDLLVFSSSRDGFNCIWGLRVDKRTKQPKGGVFAIRHFHFPSLELVVPSSLQYVVLGPNKTIISLNERSGSIWMMKSS